MERVEVTWYVVFTDQNVKRHWIHTFFKEEFLHCYCFRQIGGSVYFANPTISNIDTKIIPYCRAEDFAKELLGYPYNRILRVKYPFDFSNRMFNLWNLIPTCVSIVKIFLGITAKAQTPYQLYKHLIKRGAKPFKY